MPQPDGLGALLAYHRVRRSDGQNVPCIVHCFPRGVARETLHRTIPAEGALIGSESALLPGLAGGARLAPRHAWLQRHGETVTLRDLGSPTGTRVNGRPLQGEVELLDGDVVRTGDLLFVHCASMPGGEVPRDELIGSGMAMASLRHTIEAVAPRSPAVVVTGETGTGKELVSMAIHALSGRTGPFVAVNCGTFTEELLASELFGHARGAFTGAVGETSGLFRAARGGTLLLDELAELPLSLQTVMLRVLETRSVRPVGATRDIDIDVRMIATTNRELVDLVHEGRFRADLYSRLAQWTIRTPRLADRRGDIPELVDHLLARLGGARRRITPNLGEALLLHEWPLNVRGLLNILAIALVASSDDSRPLALGPEVSDAMIRTRSMAVVGPLDTPDGRATPAEWRPPLVRSQVELEELMATFEGHVAAGARHLGVTRSKLYRMLGIHGIDPATYRPEPPK